jgi:replicative DNA helicase
LLDESARFANEADRKRTTPSAMTLREAMELGTNYIRSRMLDPEAYQGCPTGISPLDSMLTGGLKFGEVSVIGARPSMGKTALSLALAKASTAAGKPVLFFSVEMSTRSLVLRLMAMDCGVPMRVLANEDLTDADFEAIAHHAKELPDGGDNFLIDDTTKEPRAMCRSARRYIREKGVRLVFVDYLQLMNPPRGSEKKEREQQVADTSRIFKELAKEENIHVCVLAQLNRICESRDDKKPILSDFRESGAIEQDADVCMLLWRPEYYGMI